MKDPDVRRCLARQRRHLAHAEPAQHPQQQHLRLVGGQAGNGASHSTVHSHGLRNRAKAAKPLIQEEHGLGEETPDGNLRFSSAQITNYTREELEGRLVVGVVNFPPRQIGPVRSEVLVLGAVADGHPVLLLEPDEGSQPGDRIA